MDCPHKECIIGGDSLEEIASALLDCRGFQWDTLLDGKWTGCSAGKLKELAKEYGWEKVCEAIDNG